MRLRTLLLVASFTPLVACQGWHPIARPVPNGTLEGSPEMVRVTRTSGCGATPSRDCTSSRGQVTVFNPRIQGDSLIGYYDKANRERVAMHVREVVAVETRAVDAKRTAGVAAGGGLLIGLVVAAAAAIAIMTALGGG